MANIQIINGKLYLNTQQEITLEQAQVKLNIAQQKKVGSDATKIKNDADVDYWTQVVSDIIDTQNNI